MTDKFEQIKREHASTSPRKPGYAETDWMIREIQRLRDAQPPPRKHRILWNPGRETIDEIVISHPDQVHIEQMTANRWWIGIYIDGTAEYWHGNFAVYDDGLGFYEQDNYNVEWDRDDEHGERL